MCGGVWVGWWILFQAIINVCMKSNMDTDVVFRVNVHLRKGLSLV